jgi:catechol 2,3-dioxygenase-like lactoylglutathione lyase family enzyme
MKQLNSISPIGDGDAKAVPVKNLSLGVSFYTSVLGFALVRTSEDAAVVRRDEVQISLVLKKTHDPATAGSFYIDVADLESLRQEFMSRGAKPGAIEIQSHNGQQHRVFFLRECDIWKVHNGYCWCFGQLA